MGIASGWTERFQTYFAEHHALFGWLTTGSVVFLVVSLFGLPWLIGRLPSDYFTADGQERIHRERRERNTHRALAFLLHGIRNLVGVVVALAGVAMLVLPGQGILAILVGMMLIDYPFKHRFERWLIAKPTIHRPLNWLRRKVDREPFVIADGGP
ncbi:Putative transmembrane protein (PGPGW) [Planctomycetes bacterium Poly30]|uniref:Transmembrane protein (PGPGW) n=1 Tax=Saltatorellus ferox TaxID=2528018 RepID=A0A518EPF3_9BACT|nr:Putative transmembrane protein (PGPGW) [Planctomycetes bacterium Poly30]